jgi:TPP-dependent pyruvate/acetoin dehydrogenase alpha subunit
MLKYNSASDISSTAGQMPRLLGLAQASAIARSNPEIAKYLHNNVTGNEVAFGSIGDASTSEGMFFETINAAAVMQVPLAVAVFDDGFGISVPIELQTAKSSISEVLKGFKKEDHTNGIIIYTCHGWNYQNLVQTFREGIAICREKHIPVLFHITEVTQPLGHSTSGSHERYKSKERLQWEEEYDCMKQFRKWLLSSGVTEIEELNKIEKRAIRIAREARDRAWTNYIRGYEQETSSLEQILRQISDSSPETIDYYK